jgi:uncharacterized protein DUF3306
MSEAEGFLSRWSRLKQEGIEPADDDTSPTDQTKDRKTKDNEQPAPSSEPTESAPVDLTHLPPIESINAGSDLRAFLAPGVPAELTRAALRRAWIADPAIRDFVGLAENAWDFNAPEGVPGFGPLLPTDDIKRLLAQALGSPEQRPPQESRPAGQSERDDSCESQEEASAGRAVEPQSGDPVELAATKTSVAQEGNEVIVKYSRDDVAVRNTTETEDDTVLPTRQPHGSALPE